MPSTTISVRTPQGVKAAARLGGQRARHRWIALRNCKCKAHQTPQPGLNNNVTCVYLDYESFVRRTAALRALPGGLCKLRQPDPKRGKGKRGGLRVIYFWWEAGRQFWLFTLYGKDEMADLNAKEKATLKALLKRELENRQ